MATASAQRVRLFEPTGLPPRNVVVELAPPFASLAGKRIGLLHNTKPNADILLKEIASELRRSHGAVIWELRRKPEVSAPTPGAMRLELHQNCDAVITASGD